MSRVNSASFNESVTIAADRAYPYRRGMGMINSAEWIVKMEDFNELLTSNAPTGWSAIIDLGATLTNYTGAAVNAGVARITSDAASEGVAIYLPKTVVLTGKKFFMEARVRGSSVTDNIIKMGLTDLTAVVNPEDIWTTTAASFIALGLDDGAATPTLVYDKSNAGPVTQTATASMTADTWHTLAFTYSGGTTAGTGAVRAYLDGSLILTSSTAASIPETIHLAPFIGSIAGNGGIQTADIDYVRFAIQR